MSFSFTNQNIFQPVKSIGGLILIISFSILAVALGFAVYYGTLKLVIPGIPKSLFVYIIVIADAVFAAFTLNGFYGMKYILTDEELIIKSGIFKKTIPYADIIDIESIKGKGYFYRPYSQRAKFYVPGYYYGLYIIFGGNIKKMFVYTYATSKNDIILIKKSNGTNYGISPANGELFYNSIKKSIAQVNSQTNSQANSQDNSFNNLKTD